MTTLGPTDLDSIIHGPKRLMAVSILDSVKQAEFKYLAERIGITDSDLSKQMSALVDAGFVRPRKTGRGRSSKTWFSLTPNGRRSFARYKKTLEEIIEAR